VRDQKGANLFNAVPDLGRLDLATRVELVRETASRSFGGGAGRPGKTPAWTPLRKEQTRCGLPQSRDP